LFLLLKGGLFKDIGVMEVLGELLKVIGVMEVPAGLSKKNSHALMLTLHSY